MKTLLIMRHAKSSWGDPTLADHDRPLNGRGRADAPRMGALLRQQDLTPDLIISSTAKRARTTARLAAEEMGYEGEIEQTRNFYHADPEEYIERLRRLPNSIASVMVVGHNPGMEELVEQLGGRHERFTTAAVAAVSLALDSWADLDDDSQGELQALWRPRDVD